MAKTATTLGVIVIALIALLGFYQHTNEGARAYQTAEMARCNETFQSSVAIFETPDFALHSGALERKYGHKKGGQMASTEIRTRMDSAGSDRAACWHAATLSCKDNYLFGCD